MAADVKRLDELKILDRVIATALGRDAAITLTGVETRVVARHLIRLLARDRQKAEQTRRHKIIKCTRKSA